MCQANIIDCDAEEFDCKCGVIACSVHGHVDESDSDEQCPNIVPDGADSVTPDLTHVASPFVQDGLPCHLRHRWGIFPEGLAHGNKA